MEFDYAVVWDWLAFAVRWAHVIVGIAWIGSSFYFIALDLGLRKAADMPKGVHGEEWQVHGGGFYHIEKYLVAPDRLPDHLTWFKWESYSTWLTGFAMLAVLYYAQAELYLVDRTVADLAPWQAIVLSAGSLAAGWVVYDRLCKVTERANMWALMAVLFVIVVAACWGYMQLFSSRAAFLHTGALIATWMSGNVFFVIMPNQREVVADLQAGRTPDPRYGLIAKQRSTHNNYLTLPVLFFMLSNHYPLAHATPYAVAIAALVLLMGVTIRHYFNTKHATGEGPLWTWIATVLLFIAAAWLSTTPRLDLGEANAAVPAHVERAMAAPGFAQAAGIVQARCSMCHAAEPVWEGLHWPPKGVVLEEDEQIAAQALAVYLHSAISHAMPPGNLTGMTPRERARVADWYRAAR